MDTAKMYLDLIGYFSTIVVVISIFIGVVMWFGGILPALVRLGKGLSKREIAIFATGDHASSLESLLLDSSLFRKKNITHIATVDDVGRAERKSLFLVYWPDWGDNIEQILAKKTDNAALIIYAQPGSIDREDMFSINQHRNVVVSNFRGRLINDIVVSMITTSY